MNGEVKLTNFELDQNNVLVIPDEANTNRAIIIRP